VQFVGKIHSVRATPIVETMKIQSVARWSWQGGSQKVSSNVMEGEHSTSKCQASSVFDDDSPEEAKQELTDAVHCCLHLLQNSKYVVDYVSNNISLHSRTIGN
jgi:hypothetical protein